MARRTSDKQQGKTQESRLQRHGRIAREIYAEPRRIHRHVRQALAAVWARHGAGFYGLGWVITFIVLEVNLVSGEFGESEGLSDFLSSQLLEYLLRIGFMSFINGLLAAIWPVYVLQWFSYWGIAVLIAGYLTFEKVLRPIVESRFPELRDAREELLADSDDSVENRDQDR